MTSSFVRSRTKPFDEPQPHVPQAAIGGRVPARRVGLTNAVSGKPSHASGALQGPPTFTHYAPWLLCWQVRRQQSGPHPALVRDPLFKTPAHTAFAHCGLIQ